MNRQGTLPTLTEFKNIITSLADSNHSRNIYVSYSHTFHSEIFNYLALLEMNYQIIDFNDFIHFDKQSNRRQGRLRNIFTTTIRFVTEWNPTVSMLNFLSEVAMQCFQYHLKRSDVDQIKRLVNLRKKPTRNKKLRQIILIKEITDFTDDQFQYARFIARLINDGYLPEIALFVLSDKNYRLSSKVTMDFSCYDLSFTRDDYEVYVNSPLENTDLMEIFNVLPLEYVRQVHRIKTDAKNHNEAVMKEIIHQMLYDHCSHVSKEDINDFLALCSYLFDEFHHLDLEEIRKRCDCSDFEDSLHVSMQSHLLKSVSERTYAFSDDIFKKYYLIGNRLDRETQLIIMNYLKSQYPYHYGELAIVSQFIPLKEDERLSYFIVAYYHLKTQKLGYHDVIIETLKKSSKTSFIIQLSQIRNCMETAANKDIDYFIACGQELIKRNHQISLEAKLCVLNYISDVAYETISNKEILIQIFKSYLAIFDQLKVFSQPQERYSDYILDAIVFSTCIEDYKTQKNVNRLTELIERMNFSDTEHEIKFYNLGNLLHTFNVDKASEFTRMAFEKSSDYILLHEGARLNYSVSLIGKEEYQKAYDILNEGLPHTTNYDKEMQNNMIIAGLLSDKVDYKEGLSKFKKLKELLNDSKSSDHCIILNNYISIMILNQLYDNETEMMDLAEQIIAQNDTYHTFFAQHNLLILFYFTHDHENFIKVKNQLKVPYLLRGKEALLKQKFSYLQDHFDDAMSYSELQNHLNELSEHNYADGYYLKPLLFGLIERWLK